MWRSCRVRRAGEEEAVIGTVGPVTETVSTANKPVVYVEEVVTAEIIVIKIENDNRGNREEVPATSDDEGIVASDDNSAPVEY